MKTLNFILYKPDSCWGILEQRGHQPKLAQFIRHNGMSSYLFRSRIDQLKCVNNGEPQ